MLEIPLFLAFKHPSMPGSTNMVEMPLASNPLETKPFPPPMSKNTLSGEYFFTTLIMQL
jgi:hypothetical protein